MGKRGSMRLAGGGRSQIVSHRLGSVVCESLRHWLGVKVAWRLQ